MVWMFNKCIQLVSFTIHTLSGNFGPVCPYGELKYGKVKHQIKREYNIMCYDDVLFLAIWYVIFLTSCI